MQLKKVITSLAVLLCLCTNFSAAAYADTVAQPFDYGISVMYEIAQSPSVTLTIENKTAYCTSLTTGFNAASISVTQTLEKYWGLWIWNDVKDASWSDHVNAGSIYLSTSKSGLDSGTYRVKSVFTLTDKNGKSETFTIYSDEQKIS